MSLLGFFATLVGLGAMTKDSISDSIHSRESYEKAKQNGQPTYFVFGNGVKTYSTKTGRQVITEYHNRETGGHTVIKDAKTGEIVEDLTIRDLEKKADEANKKLPNFCIFKKTAQGWVSKNNSGLFMYCDTYNHYIRTPYGEVNQFTYFKEYDPQKGELENRLANPQRQYFADGTPFSYDELNRRKLLVVKTCYKENGWKFYPTSDYDLPLQSRIKFKGDLVVCSRWRDVKRRIVGGDFRTLIS